MKKIFITVPLLAVAGCSFFHSLTERDNENYWLNNVRSYKTYPIVYYDASVAKEKVKLTDSKTLNTRTYKHNVVVSANLGQRMVDAQTYTVNKYTTEKLVANTDGKIFDIRQEVDIHKGDVYTPIGEIKMNGSYYMLISPNRDNNILLVDEQGHFLNYICHLYRGELLLPREASQMSPADLGIEQNKNSSKNVSEPRLQFEIKYDGLENGNMAFIYTDYSNASSSEGYFQRFVFPQTQDLVNLNGVKFKVMDVYPERIEYMLLD